MARAPLCRKCAGTALSQRFGPRPCAPSPGGDSSAKRFRTAKVILPPLQRGKSRSAAEGMGVSWTACGVALRRRASRGTPPPPRFLSGPPPLKRGRYSAADARGFSQRNPRRGGGASFRKRRAKAEEQPQSQRLAPLPLGEGQGEGYRGEGSTAAEFCSARLSQRKPPDGGATGLSGPKKTSVSAGFQRSPPPHRSADRRPQTGHPERKATAGL